MSHTLGSLAQRFGLELRGDASAPIDGVCALSPGQPGRIAFLASAKLRAQLAGTAAGAVIVGKRDAGALPGNGLVAPDPYVAYARIAALFDHSRDFAPGVHATAVVAPDAQLGEGCGVGPQAVIEPGAVIGAGTYVGPGCTIGRGARIGAGSFLTARVSVGHDVRIGDRCQAQPGAVIGSRGFGNAPSAQGWVEVPQLGSVVVGNDVEIGANTTIDRGAMDDTVIGDGVKLDNQIQIAHNCRIGAHTAIAACVGIAGSAVIGSRCMIGGACGIGGHLSIGDGVILLAGTMVSKSLPGPGVYGSTSIAMPANEWRKQTAHVRRLGRYEQRLKDVEARLGIDSKQEGERSEQDDL
ncbi:MAG: UDP-3-O-(3-hydroxymyristoyl)glucosamine N-acyltransferase [Nevskiaceae bacterium]|nr:MAG: UDP-3-O-(3-hydroxymyristoyl)glucosamine N-acyltransferase [Nevskiaceae bacterium]